MAPADRSNSTSELRSRRSRNEEDITWAPLLDDSHSASTLLWRLTDSVYFYLKRTHGQGSEFVGITATHFGSLLKIVALEDDAKIEARARHFQTYLNHTGVDYQVVHRDGRQHATLNRRGWLTLLAWEVRVVPIYAYKWWKRLIKHLPLLDPQTNLPFSSHPPRSVFPSKGDPRLLPVAYNFVGLLKTSISGSGDLTESRRPRRRDGRDISLPEASTSGPESAPPEHRVLRRHARPRPDSMVVPSPPPVPGLPRRLDTPSRPSQPSSLSPHARQLLVSRSPREEAGPVRSSTMNVEPFGTFPRRGRTSTDLPPAERSHAHVLSHSFSQPALAVPRGRDSLRLEIPPYSGPVSLTESSTTRSTVASAPALRPYAALGRTTRRPMTMHELETASLGLGSPGRRDTIIMPDDPRLAYNPFVQLLAGQRSLEDEAIPPATLREGPGHTNPFRCFVSRVSKVPCEATVYPD
ncbi:hypothetical protein AURDEDRAFT_116031 [Auricularia subglabra TFB-10046 SS5]|nr:hypothetical protein AURDEDRAFT_116031 [Auricularia subglabra TFB-10046 SS5]